MKVRDKKWIRFRIYLVAFLFVFGLGVILARAYQLQVLERDRLGAMASAGYKGVIKLPPKRGTIFDREGHELAISVEVGSIYAHPNLVKKKNRTANQLSLHLNIPKRNILPLLKSSRSFVWIKRRVSPEKVKQVRSLGIKGLGFTREARRYYPGKEIAAHLIGFAGADNQGLEGLEKRYDDILKGPQYTLVQMRDALGRPFFISRPTDGSYEMRDLILTIDKDIQYKAQQVLKAAVKKAGGRSGQCIILNPDTGEILAMAVVPSYNPNIFGEYRPYQWRNRTITDTYEPGSTIKIFLLAAALEKSIVSPNTKFYCELGEYSMANHVIHDTKKYGYLKVTDIIALSSNIGAVKIGEELGYKRFNEYLKRFGFGKKTSIDLIGERSGFVRPIKSARKIDRATSFFGQGMTATSLQIAIATAAIANGGKLMRPYIVKAVKDQSDQVVKETKPHMVRRVLSTETARRVGRILEKVVSERGTAPLAAIAGYRVAGKTGTSQKVDAKTRKYSSKDFVAIFVGFAPANRPKLVIMVMIDEPKGKVYGGLVAGPAFREVGAWTLNNLRIRPQQRLAGSEKMLEIERYNSQETNSDSKIELKNAGLMPDFRGRSMRSVLKDGRTLGLKVVMDGTGLAYKQVPGPGTSLKKVTSVKVSFRPPV